MKFQSANLSAVPTAEGIELTTGPTFAGGPDTTDHIFLSDEDVVQLAEFFTDLQRQRKEWNSCARPTAALTEYRPVDPAYTVEQAVWKIIVDEGLYRAGTTSTPLADYSIDYDEERW